MTTQAQKQDKAQFMSHNAMMIPMRGIKALQHDSTYMNKRLGKQTCQQGAEHYTKILS